MARVRFADARYVGKWPQSPGGESDAGGAAVTSPAFEEIQDAAKVGVMSLEAPVDLLELCVVLFEAMEDLLEESIVPLEAPVDLLEQTVVPLEAMEDLPNLVPMFSVLVCQGCGQTADIPEEHHDAFDVSRQGIDPGRQGLDLPLHSLEAAIGCLALDPESLGQSFKC